MTAWAGRGYNMHSPRPCVHGQEQEPGSDSRDTLPVTVMADIPVRKISRLPAEPPDTTTTRKPLLLLRLSGLFLLRLAARQFLGLLFHEPPRNTRLFNRIPIRRSRDEFHEAGRYAENAARHDARTTSPPRLCATRGFAPGPRKVQKRQRAKGYRVPAEPPDTTTTRKPL